MLSGRPILGQGPDPAGYYSLKNALEAAPLSSTFKRRFHLQRKGLAGPSGQGDFARISRGR
eukprot:8952060-Pyramimonas_sp.AAC.1